MADAFCHLDEYSPIYTHYTVSIYLHSAHCLLYAQALSLCRIALGIYFSSENIISTLFFQFINISLVHI